MTAFVLRLNAVSIYLIVPGKPPSLLALPLLWVKPIEEYRIGFRKSLGEKALGMLSFLAQALNRPPNDWLLICHTDRLSAGTVSGAS
ncbi:hypothetical protein GCM10027185_58620 [Spirosoma pulveris]